VDEESIAIPRWAAEPEKIINNNNVASLCIICDIYSVYVNSFYQLSGNVGVSGREYLR
jgi:hypothetical protein